MSNMVRFLTLFLFVTVLMTTPLKGAQEAIIVSGTVRDSSGMPLESVRVALDGVNLSVVLTDRDGRFRVAVVDAPRTLSLRFAAPGFRNATIVQSAEPEQASIDVVMQRSEITASITAFESGQILRGTVLGLAPGDHQKHKVVVYVLTDKWYIHPYAEGAPRRGFALIDESGRWEIETVWRGHQATKVAIVVVSRDIWAPPTFAIGEPQPESDLRSRLLPTALAIIDAPKGI